MEPVIIYGAGNVGKKALESLIRQNLYYCKGFIDDGVLKGTLIQNIPVIGSKEDLEFLYKKSIKNAYVAIGNNCQRKIIFQLLKKIGFKIISIIDPSAFVSC